MFVASHRIASTAPAATTAGAAAAASLLRAAGAARAASTARATPSSTAAAWPALSSVGCMYARKRPRSDGLSTSERRAVGRAVHFHVGAGLRTPSASAQGKVADRAADADNAAYMLPAQPEAGPSRRQDSSGRGRASQLIGKIQRSPNERRTSADASMKYRQLLQEHPYDEDVDYWHPELWARLLKTTYRHRQIGLFRTIAADALRWCGTHRAEQFNQPRRDSADDRQEYRNAGVSGRLPTTTTALKLFIRNIVYADQLARQNRELRRYMGAPPLSRSAEDGSGAEAGPKRAKSTVLLSKRRADALMKRADAESHPSRERIAADQFAWVHRLRHASLMLQIDMPSKAPPSAPAAPNPPTDDTKSRLSRRRTRRKPDEPAPAPEPPSPPEDILHRLGSSLRALQERSDAWPALLNRYTAWREFAQKRGQRNLEDVFKHLLSLKTSLGGGELSRSWDAKASGRLSRLLVEEEMNERTAAAAATSGEGDDGRSFGSIQRSTGTFAPPDRPPTHLLLMTLRHLVLQEAPLTARALARLYLDLLLHDAKAGYAHPASCFSFHAAMDEVVEPVPKKHATPKVAKSKSMKSAPVAEPVATKLDSIMPPSAEANAPTSIPSLLLRTAGPTYSISRAMQPPRGHEILNAVLRAHLRAGDSVKEMLATMRTLCGVRTGRMVRIWETERRMEGGRAHRLERARAALPVGMLREAGIAAKAREGRVHVPLLPTLFRTKDPLTPAAARALGVANADEGETARRRVAEAEQVLVYPNEESILIILEAMRDFRERVGDAVALVNAAMLVWGPPPVRPVWVPTEVLASAMGSNVTLDAATPSPMATQQVDDDGSPPPESDDSPSSSSKTVHHPDPYLRITTRTVRKLLRWACRETTRWRAMRVVEAGEGWIRASREWDAALRGLPVLAYDPRFRLPAVGPGSISEREPPEEEAVVLALLSASRRRRGPVDAEDEGVWPGTDDGVTLQSVHTEDGPTTWMSIDGGCGYLTQAEAESSARNMWYGAVARLQSMSDKKQGRRKGGVSSREEEVERDAELWDTDLPELNVIGVDADSGEPREPAQDELASDNIPNDNNVPGDGEAIGDNGPSSRHAWLNRVQGDVLCGRQLYRTRNHLVHAYERFVQGRLPAETTIVLQAQDKVEAAAAKRGGRATAVVVPKKKRRDDEAQDDVVKAQGGSAKSWKARRARAVLRHAAR